MQYGERFTILNTESVKIRGWITKVEAIKNAICLLSAENLNFQFPKVV